MLDKHEFYVKLIDHPKFDHRVIYFEVGNISLTMKKMCIKKIFKTNYQQFYDDIQHYFQFHSCSNIESLIDIIQTFKLMNTEEKLVRVRKGNDWINQEILSNMKIRNKLYKKWKQDETNIFNKLKYLKLKKKVDKLCVSAKQNYLNYKIEQAGGDSKKLWGVINSALTINSSQSKDVIKRIKKDGNEISNTQETAEEFNKFFSEVGKKLSSKIKSRLVHENR